VRYELSSLAAELFLLSAFALLGSPGPGIAALLVIGRLRGFAGGLRFFAGLQVGLALAAAISSSGLLSITGSLPGVTQLLTLAASIYLGILAWSIATSPVGDAISTENVASTFSAGLLLGISNPKAYLAFITLFASQTLIVSSGRADAMLKWMLTVAVIFVVDIAWLYVGERLGRVSLSARSERITNVVLGAVILVVALSSLRALVA
jgi:threonine/homoserine/homoserine lactone efflux protein